MKKVANKLRASGQIQDKDRYISVRESKMQMVAMLTDIQLKVREMSGLWSCVDDKEWKQKNMIDTQNVLVLIQQKINSLKGENNGGR